MSRINAWLLAGGTVVDGTGAAPRRADVLIEGDRIVRVARGIGSALAAERGGWRTMNELPTDRQFIGGAVPRLDAAGLIVAPGFIDAHTHSDMAALIDPHAEGRLFDGVTSEINGTCGASLFPLAGRSGERRRVSMRREGVEADWHDAAGYFACFESRGSSINRGFLAGHGALRAAVVGFGARAPSPRESRRMQDLLRESLRQGALGLSSGLCYPPGCFAATAELTALARVAAEFGRPYCTHMRNEGRGLLSSLREALAICRRSGAPLHVSHVKTYGRANWWKISRVESMLEAARRSGMDVTADRYPYVAAMTDLSTLLPDAVLAGGREAVMRRLRNRRLRPVLRAEVVRQRGADIGAERIRLSTGAEEVREFQSLTLAEAARRMDMDPFDAAIELLLRAQMRVAAIFFEMCEENLERILRWPYVMIGSDTSARSFTGPTAQGSPHPRSFGTACRFLGEYVLQRKLMPLPEGIARLTSLPAQRFGLADRGVVRPGAFADVVVFDPRTLHDAATYENPFQPSQGVRHLFVNGRAVLLDGRLTRALPGRRL